MKDTASVREGEGLNLEALTDYLTGKLEGVGDGVGVRLEQFPGGHSNLTYLLKAGEHEWVLRRAPLGPVAHRAHDMAREYRILKEVHPRFRAAPEVYHLCEDAGVIGAVFYLMERRRGVILRNTLPERVQEVPDYGERISRVLVDGLAELHRVDIWESGLVNIGKPEGFLERQVNGWAGRWERARTENAPPMIRVIDWLTGEMPEPSPATLIHNDYKLDNVMLDPADPGRLVAVLDWEMTTVGDPLVDVGLSLVYWQGFGRVSGEIEMGARSRDGGWYSREEFLARYARRTGRDLSNILWYEVLGTFKLAVILQQIYYRYVNGQTRDERFRDFDRRVAEVARAATERIG